MIKTFCGGTSHEGRLKQKNPARQLPLFYQNPIPISLEHHRKKFLRPQTDYKFSRNTNSVPLHVGEIALAARHYPIVFTNTQPPNLVAILGIGSAQNLFLDDDGFWKEGFYIPAYVRRYPFILQADKLGSRLSLCIDEASGQLSEKSGDALFTKGEPTDIIRKALAFCDEYRALMDVTDNFCRNISEDNILLPSTASIDLPSGEKRILRDFSIIDEVKLDALSDQRILHYRKNKFLRLIYLQLISNIHWQTLQFFSSTAT